MSLFDHFLNTFHAFPSSSNFLIKCCRPFSPRRAELISLPIGATLFFFRIFTLNLITDRFFSRQDPVLTGNPGERVRVLTLVRSDLAFLLFPFFFSGPLF